jgi:hypothetical protein
MDYSSVAKKLGKRGGLATRDKYGTEYLRQLSKKGVEARKKKAAKKTSS